MNKLAKKIVSIAMTSTFLCGLSLNSAFAGGNPNKNANPTNVDTKKAFRPAHWDDPICMLAIQMITSLSFPSPDVEDRNATEGSLAARRIVYSLKNSNPANDAATIHNILGENATIQQLSDVLKVICSHLGHITAYNVRMVQLNQLLPTANLADDVLAIALLSVEDHEIYDPEGVIRLAGNQGPAGINTLLLYQIRFAARLLCRYVQ